MASYGTFEDDPEENQDIEAQPLVQNESLDRCPICLEDLQNIRTTKLKPCNHRFCRNCIRDLSDRIPLEQTNTNVICPLCREVASSSFMESPLFRIRRCWQRNNRDFLFLSWCTLGFAFSLFFLFLLYLWCKYAFHPQSPSDYHLTE